MIRVCEKFAREAARSIKRRAGSFEDECARVGNGPQRADYARPSCRSQS
jgi:hypothetical protein